MDWTQHVTEVHARAGDAVIFSEACTHGSLPWRASHQRRALLYRYSQGHAAYTPGLASLTYPAWMATMKPEQQAVLLNPGWPSTMREKMKPSPEQFEQFTHVVEANGAKSRL